MIWTIRRVRSPPGGCAWRRIGRRDRPHLASLGASAVPLPPGSSRRGLSVRVHSPGCGGPPSPDACWTGAICNPTSSAHAARRDPAANLPAPLGADQQPRHVSPTSSAHLGRRVGDSCSRAGGGYRPSRHGWGRRFRGQMAIALARRRGPSVSALLRSTYRLVLLDEYQDTSAAHAIISAAVRRYPSEGIGHPVTRFANRSAIYGWAGRASSNTCSSPATSERRGRRDPGRPHGNRAAVAPSSTWPPAQPTASLAGKGPTEGLGLLELHPGHRPAVVRAAPSPPGRRSVLGRDQVVGAAARPR